MALARLALPALLVAAIGGLVLSRSGRPDAAPALGAASETATVLEPPAGLSPTARAGGEDSQFERKLRAKLAAAAGQAGAVEILVGAYKGEPAGGVYPDGGDRWRARVRGCWMLTNADPGDPRREALDCGNA